MIEVIFEILFELFVDILSQILIELGFDSIGSVLKSDKEYSKSFQIIGLILLASLVGLSSIVIFPQKLFQTTLFPGISLILSPIIVGIIMHKIGEWKKEHNKKSTLLATFWGGASFAFIIALIRFIVIAN